MFFEQIKKTREDSIKKNPQVAHMNTNVHPGNQAMLHILGASQPAANSTGLPSALKARFERLTGLPFDDVSVHYQSDMPKRFDADAYTQGSEIYIAPQKEGCLEHEL